MRAVSRVLSGVLAALLLVSTAVQAQGEDEAAIKAVVADFHRALAEGYRDGVLKLLMPNAVIFETGYVEASREQYAAGHLGADMLYAATVQREVVQHLLQRRCFFQDLSKKDLVSLSSIMEVRHLEAGAVVFKEGQRGDSFYVLVDGEVRSHTRAGYLQRLTSTYD